MDRSPRCLRPVQRKTRRWTRVKRESKWKQDPRLREPDEAKLPTFHLPASGLASSFG